MFAKWSNFPEVFRAPDPTQAGDSSFEVLQWLLLASDLPFQRCPIEFQYYVFDQAILRTGLFMHKKFICHRLKIITLYYSVTVMWVTS